MPKINVYLPDDLAAEVRKHDIPISAICQAALRRATERLRTNDTGFEQIIVMVGNPAIATGFMGRWLLPPDPYGTCSSEDGHDTDVYWGVAATKRGRIAVYAAHRLESWPPRLDDYDNLDGAKADDVPADILAMATTAFLGDAVEWRDI